MEYGIRNLKTQNLKLKTQSGFTLIELAIVLVVIGLLISIGVGLIGPMTKRAMHIESEEVVNAAVESIISYGAMHNHLPAAIEGIVRDTRDAWGRELCYIVCPDLLDDPDRGHEICNRRTTTIDIRICRNTACTNFTPVNNVAFVVISGGGNFNTQTDIDTARVVNVYDVGILNVDDYVGDLGGDRRPEPYDDIVKWITLHELRMKAGRVGYPLTILNRELPVGRVGETYTATRIYADGGVPFTGGEYRWSIEGLPGGLTTNPPTTDNPAAPEDDWAMAGHLTIEGTPNTAGSYRITIFVRDNNDPATGDDNIAQRSLVLTIHPTPWECEEECEE